VIETHQHNGNHWRRVRRARDHAGKMVLFGPSTVVDDLPPLRNRWPRRDTWR
jgi:hypothetical protein